MSRKEATAEHHQCLSITEEDALTELINHLIKRGLLPTDSMVKNLAEEKIRRPVGKIWSNQFVKRQKHRSTCAHLQNIDKKRVKAEYATTFQQFYQLVVDFLCSVHLVD